MKCIVLPLALLTGTLALSLPAAASGSLTRTFVSSAGVDSNPCTITQPCASFAAAYAAVASGGIVAALDPGKYGPLLITGPVTINGNGWSAITAPNFGYGIIVNAGEFDAVTLTGLEIDGTGGGEAGILVNGAGVLAISNCVIQNFAANGGTGVLMQPTSGAFDFVITDAKLSNNAFAGISYAPQSGMGGTTGVIDHVATYANRYGILIDTSQMSPGDLQQATVSNSVVSDNSIYGIYVNTTTAQANVSIDNVTVNGNATAGILANGIAHVMLGRSVITQNSTGVINSTSPNTFYTYRDNRINLNFSADVQGALSTSFATQ
jgi:hypothetical protein